MESEEAIMENENNSNLESCFRDREQKQTDEESTRSAQELSSEVTLQEDSISYLSTENLTDAVNKSSNTTSNEPYVDPNDNYEFSESAGSTTALPVNVNEDFPDYEEFISRDENVQNNNFQLAVSTESLLNEEQQDKDFSSSQEQMDTDKFSLDLVERSGEGYHLNKSGNEQLEVDKVEDSTSQSDKSTSLEKEHGDDMHNSNKLAAGDIDETNQATATKNMLFDESEKYLDDNIDLLDEDSINFCSQEKTTVDRQVSTSEKIIPATGSQDNVTEELLTSSYTQKMKTNDGEPEESFELSAEVEKTQLTSSETEIAPKDTTCFEHPENSMEIPNEQPNHPYNSSHSQNMMKGFEELEKAILHMENVLPEEPMNVSDVPDPALGAKHDSVPEKFDDTEALSSNLEAKKATSEEFGMFENNATFEGVSNKVNTDVPKKKLVSYIESDIVSEDEISNDLQTNATEEAKVYESDNDSQDDVTKDEEYNTVTDNAVTEDELDIFTNKVIVTDETSSDLISDSVIDDITSSKSDVVIKDVDSKDDGSDKVTDDTKSYINEPENVTEDAESNVDESENVTKDVESQVVDASKSALIDAESDVNDSENCDVDESEIATDDAKFKIDELKMTDGAQSNVDDLDFFVEDTSSQHKLDITSEAVMSKDNESAIGPEVASQNESDAVRYGREMEDSESDDVTDDTVPITATSEFITEGTESQESFGVSSDDCTGSKFITSDGPEEELAALVNSFAQDKNSCTVNVTTEGAQDVPEVSNQLALPHSSDTSHTPVVMPSDKNSIGEVDAMEASKDIFNDNKASLGEGKFKHGTSSEQKTCLNLVANEDKIPEKEDMESSNTESSKVQQEEESLDSEIDPDVDQYCGADLSLGDTFDQAISEPIEEAKKVITKASESLEKSVEPAANTGNPTTSTTNFQFIESFNKEDRNNKNFPNEDSLYDTLVDQNSLQLSEAVSSKIPESMETNNSRQTYFEHTADLGNLQTIETKAIEKGQEQDSINSNVSYASTDSFYRDNAGPEIQNIAMDISETEKITTDVSKLGDDSLVKLKDKSISLEKTKNDFSLSEFVEKDVTSENLQHNTALSENLKNLSPSESVKQELASIEIIKETNLMPEILQDQSPIESVKQDQSTIERVKQDQSTTECVKQDQSTTESVKQDQPTTESLQIDGKSCKNVEHYETFVESVKKDDDIATAGNSGEDDMAVDDDVKDETEKKKVAENGLDLKESSRRQPDREKTEIAEESQEMAGRETKKTDSSKSKSSKSKIHTCLVCQKICKCKYNIVRDGEMRHLCDDVCFQQFRKTPNVFLKTEEPVKPSRTSSRTTKPTLKSTPPVKDALALYQREMATRQGNNYKTCSVCQLLNLNPDQPYCSWKGLDFCGESCLGKFQASLNTSCSFCHAYIPLDMRSTCCVKIGNDMRPFCKQRCYNEFKKKLRLCACCQRDIAGVSGAFTAMVGAEGRFKDFCSQLCMKKLESEATDFEVLSLAKGGLKQETITCGLCKTQRSLKYSVKFQGKWTKLCSDLCLSAFKFTNKINLDMCDNCSTTCTVDEAQAHFVQFEGEVKRFCSDNCASLFRKANNKVVQCDWCVTKKLNFDMIEKQDGDNLQMFCSLNCLSLYRVNQQAKSGQAVPCDQCRKVEPAQYHLTMSDASVRNFCSYSCVLTFQSHFATKHTSAAPGAQPSAVPSSQLQPQQPSLVTQHPPQQGTPISKSSRSRSKTRQAAAASATFPVISNVVSLAGQGGPGDHKSQTKQNLQPPSQGTPQVPSSAATQVKTPTASGNLVPSADGKHQILIQEPPPKSGKNKSLQCKPTTQTKATSCRPHTTTRETQTDDLTPKCVVIPIPVPVYVPMPTVMYTAPAPKLVPFPIPIPVPIFIPTTRKSANGICKAIQDIVERMPADPLEAEILMMAEAVAGDKRPGDSDTDSEGDNCAEDFNVPVPVEAMRPVPREDESLMMRKREGQGEEDMIQMALRMAEEMSGPIEDLEASVEPVVVSSEAPLSQQQHQNIQSYDGQVEEEYIPARPGQQRVPKRPNRGRPPPSRVKKVCTERPYNQDGSIQSESMQLQSMEPPPDANYRLKFTYGVNAWRHWVISKNSQIENMRQTAGGHRLRPFPTDILKCTVDELNYTLGMFIREVRKPNGGEYSPDSIFYLCLGIQQYLYENNRIDNIFTDTYFEKFTDCLNEILKNIQPKINSQGQMLCRIEEEHLWESKQLGAHSPFILLNTLIYFHTKHFILKTAQEHMSLSFAQILKHWKKGIPLKGQSLASGKNVSLRFYCLSNGKKDGLAARKNKDGLPVYEVTENLDNPLRCPVKLYEFFLSKCPESIKNRNDIFYPMPERSCVPDSPVWYSTQSIDVHTMDKMLTRILLVREIQEAHLHAQSLFMQ